MITKDELMTWDIEQLEDLLSQTEMSFDHEMIKSIIEIKKRGGHMGDWFFDKEIKERLQRRAAVNQDTDLQAALSWIEELEDSRRGYVEASRKLDILKVKADELVEVISHSTPTGWAAAGDLDHAAEWEKMAVKAINEYEEVIFAFWQESDDFPTF